MLGELIAAGLYPIFVVFLRVGAILMLVPALGETSIPARVRLVLALGISILIAQAQGTMLPPLPGEPVSLAIFLLGETLIGVLIGGAARLIMSALHVAGTVIAFQTGLAFAQSFDPSQGIQSAMLGQFLNTLAVMLIFATGLHALFLAAMADSYALFPAGAIAPFGDFARLVVGTVGTAFTLGVQIAVPFIVYGLVFYTGLGLLARLMPQLQVFFIAMPLQILVGFVILGLVVSSALIWFLDRLETMMAAFVI